MEFTRCFGCMRHAKTFPCKHCGYDPMLDLPEPYYLRPGVILNGKYVVGKVLGQGGFGITYIGWNLALDSKVAIKEYFPAGQVMRDSSTKSHLHWFTTPQAKWAQTDGLEKFLKEARKMSRVSNISQVVRVQDLFQENGTAYIVMEFVDGHTLKAYMDTNGTLSWDQAKQIFLPAIQAMERVHQYGIIHRDISPDNIMIQPDGEAKILDLGAAKDISRNAGVSSMQVAKAGFSPLEQYQEGGSGTWTDVYAMAATIYYALTGVVPPAAMDRLDSKDPIRWNLPGIRTLPKQAQKALVQALAVYAKDRTQTMGALLAQLQTPEPGEPLKNTQTKTAPEEKTHQNGSGSKKNQINTIAAICAAVFLIIILGIADGKKEAAMKTVDAHVHTWQSATCSKPKTCATCGETEGTSLGHRWRQADCTEPKTCSRCGLTEGSALGHNWQPATYEAPKTCSRCGETEGDPLGYIKAVEFASSEPFSWKGSNVHKFVFGQSVKGCTDFSLYYKPTFNSGCYVSEWQLLIQDTSGNWHDDYTFTLNETDYMHPIRLSAKLNIQAVAVVPMIQGNYSWRSSTGVYELHYRD